MFQLSASSFLLSRRLSIQEYKDLGDSISASFTDDAWLFATPLAERYGKSFHDWVDLPSTKEYIDALVESEKETVADPTLTHLGCPLSDNGNFIFSIKEDPSLGLPSGDWIHPSLIVYFTRWLSPKLAVWCDRHVRTLLSQRFNSSSPSPSPFSSLSLGEKLVKSEELRVQLENEYLSNGYKPAPARLAAYKQVHSILGIVSDSGLKLLQFPPIDPSREGVFVSPTFLGTFFLDGFDKKTSKAKCKSGIAVNKALLSLGLQSRSEHSTWVVTEEGKDLCKVSVSSYLNASGDVIVKESHTWDQNRVLPLLESYWNQRVMNPSSISSLSKSDVTEFTMDKLERSLRDNARLSSKFGMKFADVSETLLSIASATSTLALASTEVASKATEVALLKESNTATLLDIVKRLTPPLPDSSSSTSSLPDNVVSLRR